MPKSRLECLSEEARERLSLARAPPSDGGMRETGEQTDRPTSTRNSIDAKTAADLFRRHQHTHAHAHTPFRTSRLEHASRRATEFRSHHSIVFPAISISSAGRPAEVGASSPKMLSGSREGHLMRNDFRASGPAATIGASCAGCTSMLSRSTSLGVLPVCRKAGLFISKARDETFVEHAQEVFSSSWEEVAEQQLVAVERSS